MLETLQRLLQNPLRRLPANLPSWWWSVSYALAWVSLPYTLFGALRNMTFINHWYTALEVRFESIAVLRAALRAVAEFFDRFLIDWKALTEPLRALLRPFDLTFLDYAVDASVVLTLLLPSLSRYIFQRTDKIRAFLVEERSTAAAEAARRKVADAEARRSARLARERAAAEARKAKAEEDASAEGAGVGAVLGAIIGGAVGGPLGIVIGGIVGAGAGSAANGETDQTKVDHDDVDHSDAEGVAALKQEANAADGARQYATERLAVSVKRFLQARLLVNVSALAAAGLLVTLVFDWGYAPRVVKEAQCRTVRDVGAPCSCLSAPRDVGIAFEHPDTDSDRRLCIVKLGTAE